MGQRSSLKSKMADGDSDCSATKMNVFCSASASNDPGSN